MGYKYLLLITIIWCQSFAIYGKSKEISKMNSLLLSLLPAKEIPQTKNFNVKGCKDYSPQWMAYFLFQQDFQASYKFSKTCDIEGKIHIKPGKSFPVSLKLKNFASYTQIKMNSSITGDLQKQTVQVIDDKGDLIGKKHVYFSFDFKVKIDFKDNKVTSSGGSGQIKLYPDNKYKTPTAVRPLDFK